MPSGPLRAGSLTGTDAGSVRLRNPRAKRNSLHGGSWGPHSSPIFLFLICKTGRLILPKLLARNRFAELIVLYYNEPPHCSAQRPTQKCPAGERISHGPNIGSCEGTGPRPCSRAKDKFPATFFVRKDTQPPQVPNKRQGQIHIPISGNSFQHICIVFKSKRPQPHTGPNHLPKQSRSCGTNPKGGVTHTWREYIVSPTKWPKKKRP